MRKQQKVLSMAAVSMAIIVTTVFLPSLVQSFFFPPAPDYQIETIIHEVEDLVTKGVLTEGQGNALNTIAGEAQKTILDIGDTATACNLLQDFINQVQAYINTGALPATRGDFLITAANDLISQLR